MKEGIPFVSIIVPVYNAERYLEQCIKSILNQSYNRFECIFVNDKSTDGSASILHKYSVLDKRIRILENDTNKGVSYTRYYAVSEAAGTWLAFVDADDVINVDYLDVMVSEISDEIDCVCCNYISFSNRVDNISYNNIGKYKTIKYENKELLELYYSGRMDNMGMYWSKLIRKNALIKFDYSNYKDQIPLSWFEDTFVFPILFTHITGIVVVDWNGYGYRISENSLSHSLDNVDYFINQTRAGKLLFEWCNNNNHGECNASIIEGSILCAMKSYYAARKKSIMNSTIEAIELFKEWFAIAEIETSYKIGMNVRLFNVACDFWCCTIGYLYFEILRKIKWKKE